MELKADTGEGEDLEAGGGVAEGLVEGVGDAGEVKMPRLAVAV